MLLTLGNYKLSKRIAVFSLAAGIRGTCNRDCVGCYALKTEALRSAVRAKRQMTVVLAKDPMFPLWIAGELLRMHGKIDAVRVHEGGDFFSQDYVKKWVFIVRQHPHIVFYAYTKRINDFDMAELAALPNFMLIDSLKPRNGLPNFADKKTLLLEGHKMICPWRKGMKCGGACTYCLTKKAQYNPPVFVKH